MSDTMEKPVIVTQATHWVVVAHSDSRPVGYEYFSHETENDALDDFAMIEAGEYRNLRAVCIFASKNGVPIGKIVP